METVMVHSRLFEIKENYMAQFIEDVVTAYAEMYIAGPESPDDISGMLQLQPTGKGGVICRSPRRKKTTAEAGNWVLSTWNMVRSEDMNVHLDWLLHRLMPEIITLQKVPGISMRIRCVRGSSECGTDAHLTAEQIKKWAELNIDCSFELYSDRDA
jgi:hypothetical protein